LDELPFIDTGIILIPRMHPDTVRLKMYLCKKYDEELGLCNDYDNRPVICRNTTCSAFDTSDVNEQQKIISDIKSEEFYKIKK